MSGSVPGLLSEPLGKPRQQTVADPVAQRIVDDLEPVDVDVEDGQDALSPSLAAQRLIEPVHQAGPVRHPGERIHEGLALQDHIRPLALGDVAQRRHHETCLGGLDLDLAGRRFDPTVRVITTQEPIDRGHAPARPHVLPLGMQRQEIVEMDVVILLAALQLGRIPAEQAAATRRHVAVNAVDGRHDVHVGRARDQSPVVERSARHAVAGNRKTR